MAKINILFYTDYRDPKNPGREFTFDPADPRLARRGLSIVRDLILKNAPKPVEVCITLINRNKTKPGEYKLTYDLLSNFHELWLFGYYQIKVDGVFDPLKGGPENELDHTEVAALERWMETGGVLITGDHAEPNPCDKTSEYLGLGRALGRCVPRAGKMRKWEGPPTSSVDNFNTQSHGKGTRLDDPNLQGDKEPQHIHLWLDEELPLDNRLPHELFCSTVGAIDIFPDHQHEGKLVIPPLVGGEWPEGCPRPSPFVVAWGADNRFSFSLNPSHFYPLVSVYDGRKAEEPVGRIVADSTWHHYANVNLRSLPGDLNGDTNPRAALNLMGQFYWNLVRWLAPENMRKQIRHEILLLLAHDPEVAEVIGSNELIVGRAAEHAAQIEGLTHDLNVLLKDGLPAGWAKLRTPLLDTLVLGFILSRYQQAFGDVSVMDSLTQEETLAISADAIRRGMRLALVAHLSETERQAEDFRKLLKTLPEVAGESE